MGKIHPVLLSGGSGTRLWPLSRAAYPKQLLSLTGDKTLIQETARRVSDSVRFEPPVIICNDAHRFTIAAQLLEIGIVPSRQILEPFGRNTAPAAAVAALLLRDMAPDAMMLLLPADHFVGDFGAFQASVDTASKLADDGNLVTFGIQPASPETAYGYIRPGDALGEAAHRVAAFEEKPAREVAERYVSDGYLWNSGMFMFRVSALLDEMEALCPEIVAACQAAISASSEDLDFLRLDADGFGASPSISLDHAVMEHTSRAAVVPAEMGWCDVGSWTSLWSIGNKDSAGNVSVGDVVLKDSRDCYVRSEGRLVTALGVDNLVVVETADAVMVAHKDGTETVKDLVSLLKDADRIESAENLRVHRPWGYYESIDQGPRHQVKHLFVHPGSRLSLQKHFKRSEHWVVVEGEATVTVGEEVRLLSENESVYIPVETKHRLENAGPGPLRIIEVQSGSYLGEDDIVRFEDDYHREAKPKHAAE